MIQEHETWSVIDSSKIDAYMQCPRRFFYEYVLGWRSDKPNVHLIFGTAYHLAMEYLILHGHKQENVIPAFNLFMNEYRKSFDEMTDLERSPKDPAHALMALNNYIDEYADDAFEPIYTEISGSVPIDATHVLFFRQDSILRVPHGIISREHKTGSRLDGKWDDKWSLTTQVGTYHHVLYCLFPEEEVSGVEINGTFLYKNDVKFHRVPIHKGRKHMQVWFWNTKEWYYEILRDYDRILKGGAEDEDVMKAFRMDSSACSDFYGCPYIAYCKAWPNPLQHVEEVPIGMKVERWDPRAEDSKHVFNLTE